MRVLIVDDAEDNLYLLETLLRNKGYNVTSAQNGEEALECLRKDSFHLIISDILMPQMDGFQLCRHCKTDPQLKNIPFVFYSATYTDAKDEEFALGIGADKFIVKPAQADRFLQIIEEILREHQQGTIASGRKETKEEETFLSGYSKRLIDKLESKMLDLEKANKALVEAEKRFRTLVYTLGEIVYEYHVAEDMVLWTGAYEELLGCTGEEMGGDGRSRLNRVHQDDLSALEAEFTRARRENQLIEVEYRFRHKNGNYLWIHDSGKMDISPDGVLLTVTGIMKDITKRKQAEESLRESESRLSAIIEFLPDATFVIDLEGKVIAWNKAIVEMSGIKAADIVGKGRYEYALPFYGGRRPILIDLVFQSASEIEKKYLYVRKEGETLIAETDIPDLQGKRTFLWGKAGPLYDSRGNLIGAIEQIREITEHKLAEYKLKETMALVENAYKVTIEILVSAIEARDPYTAGHQRRVANLAGMIAIDMDFPAEKIEGIRTSGYIHDIGKISIPAGILNKTSSLSDNEFDLIKEHSRIGYDILKVVESPWPIAEIIYQHHERMDGSGYPRGIKGEEILLEARILAVADVVEAMASHRPYRPAYGIDVALQEIEKNRNVLYDQDVVDACLKVFGGGYTIR